MMGSEAAQATSVDDSRIFVRRSATGIEEAPPFRAPHVSFVCPRSGGDLSHMPLYVFQIILFTDLRLPLPLPPLLSLLHDLPFDDVIQLVVVVCHIHLLCTEYVRPRLLLLCHYSSPHRSGAELTRPSRPSQILPCNRTFTMVCSQRSSANT